MLIALLGDPCSRCFARHQYIRFPPRKSSRVSEGNGESAEAKGARAASERRFRFHHRRRGREIRPAEVRSVATNVTKLIRNLLGLHDPSTVSDIMLVPVPRKGLALMPSCQHFSQYRHPLTNTVIPTSSNSCFPPLRASVDRAKSRLFGLDKYPKPSYIHTGAGWCLLTLGCHGNYGGVLNGRKTWTPQLTVADQKQD